MAILVSTYNERKSLASHLRTSIYVKLGNHKRCPDLTEVKRNLSPIQSRDLIKKGVWRENNSQETKMSLIGPFSNGTKPDFFELHGFWNDYINLHWPSTFSLQTSYSLKSPSSIPVMFVFISSADLLDLRLTQTEKFWQSGSFQNLFKEIHSCLVSTTFLHKNTLLQSFFV